MNPTVTPVTNEYGCFVCLFFPAKDSIRSCAGQPEREDRYSPRFTSNPPPDNLGSLENRRNRDRKDKVEMGRRMASSILPSAPCEASVDGRKLRSRQLQQLRFRNSDSRSERALHFQLENQHNVRILFGFLIRPERRSIIIFTLRK